MDDRDRAEMRALADQFRELMARQNEVAPFNEAARQRIGDAIGKAARQGGSGFTYLRRQT
jgi:hypothetical protein